MRVFHLITVSYALILLGFSINSFGKGVESLDTVGKTDTLPDCSNKKTNEYIEMISSLVVNSSGPSLPFEVYKNIDSLMFCDFNSELDGPIKRKALSVLNNVKKSHDVPFVWADSSGVALWSEGIKKLSFLPSEIRVGQASSPSR